MLKCSHIIIYNSIRYDNIFNFFFFVILRYFWVKYLSIPNTEHNVQSDKSSISPSSPVTSCISPRNTNAVYSHYRKCTDFEFVVFASTYTEWTTQSDSYTVVMSYNFSLYTLHIHTYVYTCTNVTTSMITLSV